MSDNLVKRLRDRGVCSPAQNSCRNDFICEQAADRIEELEAKLRSMALDCLAADGQAAEAYQAQLLVEAKLEKAVEIAEKSIKWLRLYGADVHREAATLAELKGET